VTVSVASIQELKASFRLIKEAILGWHSERGRDCKPIIFTVLAEVTLRDEIKDFLQLVYAHEAEGD
jgi:hypothetical protein